MVINFITIFKIQIPEVHKDSKTNKISLKNYIFSMFLENYPGEYYKEAACEVSSS